ncbi:MAG: type II secretion system protein GspJ [Candidatus Omnitrophota bacterium]
MKKSRSAFTLLELLLAVTIFAIIATVLYSTFNAGMKILRRSEELMKYHQDIRLVMDEIALDLHNCLLTELSEASSTEAALPEGYGESEEEPIYYFKGEAKSFSFVTLKEVFTQNGMRRGTCNVTYSLKGGDSGSLVRLDKSQSAGFASSGEGGETLLTGVNDIEVSYSYAPEDEEGPTLWLDNWEQEEKVPLGVKVKLKLKGLGSVQEVTKTVFIDVGVLGIQEEDLAESIPGISR